MAVLLLAAAGVALATRGGGAPEDGVARLVPADALLYAHVSTSGDRTQDARLLELASRFSTVRAELPRLAMAFTPGAGVLRFDRDVRPWLGDEAGVALLDAGNGRTEPLLVAEVRDRSAAEAMLGRVGATPAGSYRGTALRHLEPRATAAFAGDHLLAGPDAAVRVAIDRAAGAGTPSLADGPVFRRAAQTHERSASADVFATAPGLRRLLDGRTGVAGIAGRLLAGASLEGVDAQLSAEEGGARVRARLLRAPGARPGQAFAPSLAGRVPADAAGFADLPGLDAVAALLQRTGGAAALEGLRDALPRAAGLELEDLLAPLGDEAALTVTTGAAAPVFTVTARTRDEAATREGLARLQGPLADRLAGGAPFDERQAGGVTTSSLPVTPELQPSYAVARGTVVASTAQAGMAQLSPPRAAVTGRRAMDEIAPAKGAKVEALGFLDPRQLLALGERTGLRVPGFPAVRDDLRRFRAAGAVVEEDTDHPTDTTAELFLEIP